MPELSDAEVFGTQELSDAEVFGPSPAPRAKRTREEVAASIPPSDTEVPFLTRLGSAAYSPVGILSKTDPSSAITEAITGGAPNNPIETPHLPYETARKAVRFISPLRGDVGSIGSGVEDFIAGLASSLTSLKGIAGILSGKINRAAPAFSFVPEQVKDIPQATQNLYEAQDPAEQARAFLNLAMDVGAPVGLSRAGMQKPVPYRLGPEDYPPGRIEDLGPETIPTERQLPLNAGPNAPYSPRFVASPSGQMVDFSQLSPREQAELLRGPRAYSPREEQVRPAQQPLAIIGQQEGPRIKSIEITPEGQTLVSVVIPSKPPVEPSGGKISFRAPAEAGAVPSALQTATGKNLASEQEMLMRGAFVPSTEKGQTYASPIRSPQAEVPQVGNVGKGGGETLGKDIQQLGQEVRQTEPSQLRQEGEGAALKDAPVKYLGYQEGAGSIPGFHLYNLTETIGPKLTKGSTVSEASLAKEGFGIPEGEKAKESPLPKTGGMQVRAALEKGRERRKETGAWFPKGDEGVFRAGNNFHVDVSSVENQQLAKRILDEGKVTGFADEGKSGFLRYLLNSLYKGEDTGLVGSVKNAQFLANLGFTFRKEKDFQLPPPLRSEPVQNYLEKALDELKEEHGPIAANALHEDLVHRETYGSTGVFPALDLSKAFVSRAGDNAILRFSTAGEAEEWLHDNSEWFGEDNLPSISGSIVQFAIRPTLEIAGYDWQPFMMGDIVSGFDVPESLTSLVKQEDAAMRYQGMEGFYTKDPNKLFEDLVKIDKEIRRLGWKETIWSPEEGFKKTETPPIDPTKFYGGIPVFDPEFWKGRLGRDAETVKAGAAKAKAGFNKWITKALDQPRPLGWSPYWQASKEERAQALLGPGEHRTLDLSQPTRPQPGEKSTIPQDLSKLLSPAANALNKADKILMPNDVLADYLDKGKAKFGGPILQHIVWPLDDSFQAELALRDSHINPIANLKKSFNLTREDGERIGVYLHSLQEGGRERMIASGIEPSVIDKIVKGISQNNKNVANVIRKHLDELFPFVAKQAKELYNLDVTPVENYFSWQRDWAKYDKDPANLVEPKIDTGSIDWLSQAYPRRGTKTVQGFTIERQKGAETPIKVDAFQIYDRHIRDVSHFLAMQKHLKEIGEVVRDERFAQKYGRFGQELMLDRLNNDARQGHYENKIQWLDSLRKRVGVGVIAYRLGSQFVHLANVPLAIQRAGPVWWSRGLNEALGQRGRDFLRKHFAETYERGGAEPALYELETSPLSHKNVAQKAYKKFEQGGFVIQRAIDQLNAQATVLGIYMRKLAEKGLDPNKFDTLPVDRQSVAEARVLSRRAVASPLYKDVPGLLTKGSVARLWAQFQNVFLDQWSNIRYDLPEYLKNDPKQAMKLAVAITAMMLVEAGVKFGAKQITQQATGYTPKDDETFAKKLAHESLRRIPGMGQLMTQTQYGGTGVPALDVAREALRSGQTIYTAEDTKNKKLAATKVGTAIGELAGIPGASQAGELVQKKMKAEYFKSHEQRVKEVAKGMFGKNEGLSLEQRREAEQKYKETKEPLTREEQVSSGRAAIKNIAERGSEIENRLDKKEMGWLKANKLKIPGHSDTINLEGTRIVLSAEEMKKYEDLLLKVYKERLALFQKYPGFDKHPQSEKQKEFSKEMADAAKEAREEMTYILDKANKSRVQ